MHRTVFFPRQRNILEHGSFPDLLPRFRTDLQIAGSRYIAQTSQIVINPVFLPCPRTKYKIISLRSLPWAHKNPYIFQVVIFRFFIRVHYLFNIEDPKNKFLLPYTLADHILALCVHKFFSDLSQGFILRRIPTPSAGPDLIVRRFDRKLQSRLKWIRRSL